METLVITLREGMEIALVVGLVLAYLRRTGRGNLAGYVYGGLGLAILASLLGALAFRRLGLDPENEMLEGTLFALAAVMVATLAIWMQRTARGVQGEVAARIEGLAQRPGRERLGLLAFTFFMVLREGIELVLFLAVLSLAAGDALLQVLGGFAGIALATLFGVLLVQGTLRIDLRRFFRATSAVLVLLVARLLAGSVHELTEVGLLPTPAAVMAVVGFIVQDTTSVTILAALVLLPVLAMLPDLRSRRVEDHRVPAESAAERRLRLAAARRARLWQIGAASLTIAVALSLGWTTYASALAAYRPKPEELDPDDDDLRVDTEALEPERLYKYLYRGAQAAVRFLVVKRTDQDVAVALDVCAICPPAGYRQEGDQILCENCNAPINLDTIGLAGGCNPVPLPFTLAGGVLRVARADLDAAQARFRA